MYLSDKTVSKTYSFIVALLYSDNII